MSDDSTSQQKDKVLRVALVHDWLNQVGGAENVLIALKEIFPDAPVFTSIYDRERMPAVMRGWEIRTSFLDRIPGIYRNHQIALPLYPFAWEQFDFSGFDVVLSNKSGFCHGIITPPETTHLCYCLTPTTLFVEYGKLSATGGGGAISPYDSAPPF